MVDTAIFTSSAGAKTSLGAMRHVANNLANANSVGFRADYETFAKFTKTELVSKTRVMPITEQAYTDMSAGPITFTGRELDVAIDGPGFIAVQSRQGQEAYTRAGNLQISPHGFLVNGKGDLVLETGGAISVPPLAFVNINKFGEVYAHVAGEPSTAITQIGKIKLVEIDGDKVSKGEDGLYYPSNGTVAAESGKVKLVPESLEGSNVEIIRALTDMVEHSRHYDMHTKLMKSVDENAAKANELLST